jgi:uncharacterized protein YjbI with pentapeptide repeats
VAPGTAGRTETPVLNEAMTADPVRANTGPLPADHPVPVGDRVVQGEDWHGRILTDRHSWTGYTFLDTDWTEVANRGAVFDSCVFAGVRFNASRHTGAVFTDCVFRRCTFFDTCFTDCRMLGSVFRQSTFTLLEVVRGDWSFTGLPGADLRGASFSGVRMREADLAGARLEKASVTGTDLTGAMLHSARLEGTDLRGSELSALNPLTVRLAGAKIDAEQAVVIATALGLRVC